MRQIVTVVSCQGSDAVVQYRRPTACHGDCSHCAGGCSMMAATEVLTVNAENRIGAKPGDRVWIQGETKKVVWAVALVYVLPLVLFFLGYFLVDQNLGSGGVAAGIGFFFGLAIAAAESFLQKKHGREIRYQIISFAEYEPPSGI